MVRQHGFVPHPIRQHVQLRTLRFRIVAEDTRDRDVSPERCVLRQEDLPVASRHVGITRFQLHAHLQVRRPPEHNLGGQQQSSYFLPTFARSRSLMDVEALGAAVAVVPGLRGRFEGAGFAAGFAAV